MVGIATLGNGNQDQLISLIVLLAFSGSPLFLRLMGHAGWISQEELTPHPFPVSKKGLPYQWAKACPFPSGMASHHLSPVPGGQDLRHCSELVVFSLSFIPALIKEGLWWLCLLHFSYGDDFDWNQRWESSLDRKWKGNLWAKPFCLREAWIFIQCQPFHPTEDQRWMPFHSQVRAGSACSRALWFSCDEARDLWGEISEIKKVKNMVSISQGVSDDCHWLLLVLEVMCTGLSSSDSLVHGY